MKQVTVRQLRAHLNMLVAAGHGDKYIVLADDNEGNGYHGMFYLSTTDPKLVKALIGDNLSDSVETNPDNIVVLG